MLNKWKKLFLVMGLLALVVSTIAFMSLRNNPAHAQQATTGDLPPLRYMALPPTHQLTSHVFSANQAQNTETVNTVPFWNSSFSVDGKNYDYMMVGTDPHNTSVTTTIPVDLIPLNFVFSDGSSLNGTRIAHKIAASPIFRRARYATGDFTQYLDAIQRAEFWQSVSTTSPDYHLLLARPEIKPLATLTVPAASGTFPAVFHNMVVPGYGAVDNGWLQPQLEKLVTADSSPTHLTIFAALNVVPTTQFNGQLAALGGYHSLVVNNNNDATNVYTYAFTGYNQGGKPATVDPDVISLSHEMSEWANDPFVNNAVPVWSVPDQPAYGCQVVLEVGDPLANQPFTVGYYHVQNEAFFSWFARETPSQGFNGQYDFLGKFSTFSSSANCTGTPTPAS